MTERRDNDFFGGAVNRAARIMSVAHGGQVLLSQAVATLIGERLPPDAGLLDLGTVRLRDLENPERVFQLVHPGLRRDFPSLRSLEATPNNLPQQLSSFVGRERELAEIRKLLGNTRLLTLIGAGGLGKTRLTLHARRRLARPVSRRRVVRRACTVVGRAAGAASGGIGARGDREGGPAGDRGSGQARPPTGECCWSWTIASI